MRGILDQNSEHGYGGHPHHLFRIPVADATTHDYTEEMPAEEMSPETSEPPSAAPNNTAGNNVKRRIINKCASIFGELQKSLVYKVFFEQSSHVLMVLAVFLVVASLMPVDPKNSSIVNDGKVVKPRTLVNFVYLTAFSMHIGSQFWMTFVSGLSLYFNLSRHAFGEVQNILFPKYFSINSGLSAITLVQFGKVHVATNVWDRHTYIQLFALSLCFLLELSIRLYVVPLVLRLIAAKMAIEKKAGVGKEVGRCDLGRLVDCPHYMNIHLTFRRVHMVMAMGNVITMVCSLVHLAYIAA